MSLKKLAIAALAASVALSAAAPAHAGPNGPKDFQNKVEPKKPWDGPKDFKLPPHKKAPKPHHHGHHGHHGPHGAAALGFGIGLITAAAIAASAKDDAPECWRERRRGGLVTVCVDE